MKVAIVGSRNLTISNLKDYLPPETSTIISGGAKGIDTCAKNYALENNIDYIEFKPNYSLYKKAAPLKRNEQIVENADMVLAFWDGISKGTKYTMDFANKLGIKVIFVCM